MPVPAEGIWVVLSGGLGLDGLEALHIGLCWVVAVRESVIARTASLTAFERLQ